MIFINVCISYLHMYILLIQNYIKDFNFSLSIALEIDDSYLIENYLTKFFRNKFVLLSQILELGNVHFSH